jgi:Rieske Fe-S protein
LAAKRKLARRIIVDRLKRLAACQHSTEQCWDCPCHGSQFAPDGAVLNGPALSPLGDAARPVERKRRHG